MEGQRLCELCSNIAFKDLIEKIPLRYHPSNRPQGRPHYSTLRLRLSVAAGCAFCAILMESIQSRLSILRVSAAIWTLNAQIRLYVDPDLLSHIYYEIDPASSPLDSFTTDYLSGNLWVYAQPGKSWAFRYPPR